MKILFISAILPYPLYSGGQIRIYNLLKTLSQDHEISLFSFIRDEKENQFRDKLAFCKRIETVYRGHAWQASYVFRSFVSTYPFLMTTYANRFMQQKIRTALLDDHYDLVHIEPGYVFPSLPKISVPLVVAEHNIEHTIYEGYIRKFPIVPLRPLLYADVLKLMWWEKKIWRRADHLVAVSEDDKKVIGDSIDTKKITVVPNGVDLGQFPFSPKKYVDSDKPVFLFVGNFSWIQNQDAVVHLLFDLWPMIIGGYPRATIRIVGRNMPDRMKKHIKDSRVKLLEGVSEISDEYRKADILLAPIRIGGGTKFKILEAMASGVPVITTTQGAAGLDVSHGKELMIADSSEKMVEAVSLLLAQKGERENMIKTARRCIEEHYSWERIAKILANVWENVATNPNIPKDNNTIAPPAGRLK